MKCFVVLLAVCVVQIRATATVIAHANNNGWGGGGGAGGLLASKAALLGLGGSGYGGYGGYGGGSSKGGSGKPPRGSQIYLQDPWNHEHNYHGGWDLGPHKKHGWGSSGGHDQSWLPEQATYVQKLVPVLNLGSKLKRLSSHLENIHPHLKWQKPHLAFFGLDGSAHNVHLSHGGGWENDGWSYNHGSHHIGHKLNSKPHYSTW